jgi:hypothetical protein
MWTLRTVVETLGKGPERFRAGLETLEKVVETLRRCPDTPEVRLDTLASHVEALQPNGETLRAWHGDCKSARTADGNVSVSAVANMPTHLNTHSSSNTSEGECAHDHLEENLSMR